MARSARQDAVVRVMWPLLERATARLTELVERFFEEIRQETSARVAIQGSPFPDGPAAWQAIVLTAQGPISRGEPLCCAQGAADRATALAGDESSISGYLGIAAHDAADQGPILVWHSGPCPLFSGLSLSPVLPDTREVYVFGSGAPAVFSAIPPSRFYRACGTVLNPTTILLSKGDVFATPA